MFKVSDPISQSKTDWKYSQHNVNLAPGVKNIETTANFYFKKMYFVLWAKRGEGYRGDIAIDDFMFREGKCQEIPGKWFVFEFWSF